MLGISFYNYSSICNSKKLKDLTHMLCNKLYKKGVFFYVLTLNYTPISAWVQKSLTLQTKHKIK